MENHFLPYPFPPDPADTFMDLFNTLYWTSTNKMYSLWHSVYPPLNFLLIKFISIIFSYKSSMSSVASRELSESIFFVSFIYLMIFPALIIKFKSWDVFLTWEKVAIYFIFILSPAFLFAVERANLILLVPIIIAFTLSQHSLSKILGIAILVNLKINFILLFIYFLIIKDIKSLLKCLIISLLIFLISALNLSDNSLLIFGNLFNFIDEDVISLSNQIYASINFFGITKIFSYLFLNSDKYDLLLYVKSHDSLKFLVFILNLSLISILTYFAIKLSSFLDKNKLDKDSNELFILTLLITLNIGSFNMLYNLIIIFPLFPFIFKTNLPLLKLVFLLLFVQIDPFYFGFNSNSELVEKFSYLYNSDVSFFKYFGPAVILRPILVFYLCVTYFYYLKNKLNTKGEMN